MAGKNKKSKATPEQIAMVEKMWWLPRGFKNDLIEKLGGEDEVDKIMKRLKEVEEKAEESGDKK